jgi:hypothetical protein
MTWLMDSVLSLSRSDVRFLMTSLMTVGMHGSGCSLLVPARIWHRKPNRVTLIKITLRLGRYSFL